MSEEPLSVSVHAHWNVSGLMDRRVKDIYRYNWPRTHNGMRLHGYVLDVDLALDFNVPFNRFGWRLLFIETYGIVHGKQKIKLLT